MVYESIRIFRLVLMRNWTYDTAKLILITLPLQSDVCGNGIDNVLYKIHPFICINCWEPFRKYWCPTFGLAGCQQPAYLFCFVHCCNFVIHG